MAFKAGDVVVHPHHGIGHVVRLGARQFGPNSSREYYEVTIAGGTIWVPAAGPGGALRRVTPSTELPKYRRLLRSPAVALATDSKQRKSDVAERARSGSFESRCELLRDLFGQRQIKPLDEFTSTMLRRVRESLCAEWAASLGSTSEEAGREVDALLVEGQGPLKSRAG